MEAGGAAAAGERLCSPGPPPRPALPREDLLCRKETPALGQEGSEGQGASEPQGCPQKPGSGLLGALSRAFSRRLSFSEMGRRRSRIAREPPARSVCVEAGVCIVRILSPWVTGSRLCPYVSCLVPTFAVGPLLPWANPGASAEPVLGAYRAHLLL